MKRMTRLLSTAVLTLGLLLHPLSVQAADEPGAPAGGGAAPAAPAPAPAAPSTPATTTMPEATAILSGGAGGPTAPPVGSMGGSGFSGRFAGGLLYERIEGDSFITIDLYNTLSIGPVSFGIWVPLRLRIIDADPQNDGVFRKEDWDEFSDWVRIFRFVEVNIGGANWRFRGRFGELDGESIGHGTLLGGYYNVLDRAHYQAGLAFSGALKWGGIEFMLDNLVDPAIFGLRLHARPASFFTQNKWANKAIVGFSLVGDARAPVRQLDTDGDGKVNADGERNLKVDTTALTMFGFDLEYELLRHKLIDIVPYMDLNFIADERTGVGFHLGFFFNLRIPIPILKPTLLTRLEYRAIGKGYAPRYVDSTYEAQRLSYNASNGSLVDPTSNLPLTKLGWLRTAPASANGWLGELYFDFLAGFLRIGGSYEDYTGDNNAALTLALLLPKLSFVQAGAYYANRGFDSISQAFDLANALLRAFLTVKVWGPVALTASYTRTWELDPDSGKYEAQGNWSAGIGVSFGY